MHILVLLYHYNLKDGHFWLPLNPLLSEKHNSQVKFIYKLKLNMS
jgi:hypothetical protein